MSTRVEQVTDVVAYQAEGPVWSPRWGGQLWVDMLAGDVLSLGSDGSIERRHVGEITAALRLRGGGAVIGIEQGFALEDPDGAVRPLGEVWSDPSMRINEGGCDPDGASTAARWRTTSDRERPHCTAWIPTAPT